MEKRDWLLLCIDDRMEPIQIQKTLFKFAMEANAPTDELYAFVPYNWGPLSTEIYDDLRELREQRLVEFVPSGLGWNIYHLTEDGRAERNRIKNQSDSTLVSKMDATRSYVTSRNFETLLEDIYKDYPDYAKESLFRKE
jgi:DNA-binding PadR family transcriptional regulator